MANSDSTNYSISYDQYVALYGATGEGDCSNAVGISNADEITQNSAKYQGVLVQINDESLPEHLRSQPWRMCKLYNGNLKATAGSNVYTTELDCMTGWIQAQDTANSPVQSCKLHRN